MERVGAGSLLFGRQMGSGVVKRNLLDPVVGDVQEQGLVRAEMQCEFVGATVMVDADSTVAAIVGESVFVSQRVLDGLRHRIGNEDEVLLSVLTNPEVGQVVAFNQGKYARNIGKDMVIYRLTVG